MTSPGRMSLPHEDFGNDDDISIDDFESNPIPATPTLTDAKTLERMVERSYVRDWKRLGVCNNTSPLNTKGAPDQFRLTSVNSIYSMCRRYVRCIFLWVKV